MIPETPQHDARLNLLLRDAIPVRDDSKLTNAIMRAIEQQQAQKVDTKADTLWSVRWTMVALLLIPFTIITLPYMASNLSETLNQLLPNGQYVAFLILAMPVLGVIIYRIDSLSQQWLKIS
jgi:hypothetical protein